MGGEALIPACDSCHNRKVKCDRQDPCMNCVDARMECLRTRQTRVHRPRVSRIDALSERLARLEKTGKDDTSLSPPTSLVAKSEPIRSLPSPPKAPQYDPVKSSTKRKYPTTSSSISDSTSLSNPLEPKRRASAGAVAEFRNERHPLSATHQATEAREYLENELQYNPALSQDRRSALESARKFVGQLTNPCFTRHVGIQEEFDIEEDLPRPTLTPELLYMMLPGPDGVTNSQNLWIWPDHIGAQTLERMGLAIIEGTESEHVLLYYRVIVWTKVVTFLMGLITVTPSEPLKDRFKYLQRQFRSAAFHELNMISVSAAPSLVLLQALLSGKRLMQYLGNQSRCWMFVSYAAKVLVALGYHNITNPVPRDDVEEEIHACMYTCFYFDNTLSLLLLRPVSMPKLKVNPVDLVHMDAELPFKAIISGIVELALVKDALIQILLESTPISDMEKANILSDLVKQSQNIYAKLQIQRHRQERDHASTWGHLECSWLSLDFNYYSTLTTIIRARSSVLKSRLMCEDCLYTARKASTTLRELQHWYSSKSIDTGFPYFLTWTILIFPLTPFFVLFCNVVATSDHKDFELMKTTTDDLRRFAEIHPPISKLYGLFSKFMDICAPLMEIPQRPQSNYLIPVSEQNNRNSALEPYYGDVHDRAMDQLNILPTPLASKVNSGVSSVAGWDDSLMWELFDNQPSLGWAESGFLDAINQLAP